MARINGFVGRRDFLKLAGLVGIASASFGGSLLWSKQQVAVADVYPVNPHQALKRLLDGNQRFLLQQRQYPDQSLERLRLLTKAQYPFASILGCADSRVPAEIIFDQGLGNLFVVRVAGNVASDMIIGSLEYSTAVLGSQLVVVLGHISCGAVVEAIKNEPHPGKINFVVEGIKPALAQVNLSTGNIYVNAVTANIKYQAEQLQKSSTILAKLISVGKLKIVSACYDINTGKVNIIK
ncbi:MAG: carbonic anhydrase [Mojavia pulchra JT2-VF2]|jgi:carbonic anhydrase|uniref:carbonic anhydrase n=1 Tax=Mojavia pulchra JT2-VF2 TaxID=287848 RepID=A0A951Q3H8_9NOST|nr:carbonic anhydrase [Mojavia pulchra JT2-VF2]